MKIKGYVSKMGPSDRAGYYTVTLSVPDVPGKLASESQILIDVPGHLAGMLGLFEAITYVGKDMELSLLEVPKCEPLIVNPLHATVQQLLEWSIKDNLGQQNYQRLAKHLFHRLWGMNKEHDVYEKQLWQALQNVLLKLGVTV